MSPYPYNDVYEDDDDVPPPPPPGVSTNQVLEEGDMYIDPTDENYALAQGWAEFDDVTGSKYYYHMGSNTTSWIRPCKANAHRVQLRPVSRTRRPTALANAYPAAAARAAVEMFKAAGGSTDLYEDREEDHDSDKDGRGMEGDGIRELDPDGEKGIASGPVDEIEQQPT